MTLAILLLACLVLAAAVGALAAALSRLRTGIADELVAMRAELDSLGAAQRVEGSRHGPAGARPARPAQAADAPSATGEERGAAASAPGSTSGTPGAPSSTHDAEEYVITRLGDGPESEPAPTVEPRLFADIVLRESVVKAASLAHGVRRGLSPANRNRIWFEMRREVKRARKDRKAEEREAIREWRARQRAAVRQVGREESAA